MKKRILKLVKHLKTFTLKEISMIAECDVKDYRRGQINIERK